MGCWGSSYAWLRPFLAIALLLFFSFSVSAESALKDVNQTVLESGQGVALCPTCTTCELAYDSGSLSCGGSGTISGSLSQGQVRWYKLYLQNTGTLRVRLSGPDNSDFDLFLFSACNNFICNPLLDISDETCLAKTRSGQYYYIKVAAYRGSGGFTVSYSFNCDTQSCDSTLNTCSNATVMSNGTMRNYLCIPGSGRQYYRVAASGNCNIVSWVMAPAPDADYDLWLDTHYSSNQCQYWEGACRRFLGVRGRTEVCAERVRDPGTFHARVTRFGGTGDYAILANVTPCPGQPSCTDECSSGQRRCNGSYSQTCGNYDADSCLEWPSSTSGSGNTHCSNGCNISSGQCNSPSCSPHASYACHNGNVYWYDSCSQREDIKQDCGNSSCNAWSGNYCRSGSVYRSRVCFDKGCSGNSCYSNPRTEEQLVQNCASNQTCQNGACVNSAVCTRNSDCGSEGWAGNTHCQGNNIYRDYRTFTCNNPGTASSSCSSSTQSRLYQSCPSNQACQNGECRSTSLGSEDYCSQSNKCSAGQGDCDNDSECQSGLKCVQDVGARYGFASTMDVCETITAGWGCKDSQTVAYINSDGSWGDTANCIQGCSNGTCRDSGIPTTDSDRDGFSDEDEMLVGSNPNNFSDTPISVIKQFHDCQILLPILLKEKLEKDKIDTVNFSHLCEYIEQIGLFAGAYGGGTSWAAEQIHSLARAFPNDLKLLLGIGPAGYEQQIPVIEKIFKEKLASVPTHGVDAQLVWQSLLKPKYKEANNVAPTLQISDGQAKKLFSHYFVKGQITGYTLMDPAILAASIITPLPDEILISALIGKSMRGVTSASFFLKNKFPGIQRIIKTGGNKAIETLLKKGTKPEWIETAIGKGAKITDTANHFITKAKNGIITWLEEGGVTLGGKLYTRARHVTGELLTERRLTGFFPTGKTITIESKSITLPARMTEEQVYELIKEVIKSPASEVLTGDVIRIVNRNVNKYGIKSMEIKIQKNGFIHSAYPLLGEDVYAWDKVAKEFVQQNR